MTHHPETAEIDHDTASTGLPAGERIPMKEMELEADMEQVRKMQDTFMTIADHLEQGEATFADALYRTRSLISQEATRYTDFIDTCPRTMVSDLRVPVHALQECETICHEIAHMDCRDPAACKARLQFVCEYAMHALEDLELVFLFWLPGVLHRNGRHDELSGVRAKFRERTVARNARLGL